MLVVREMSTTIKILKATFIRLFGFMKAIIQRELEYPRTAGLDQTPLHGHNGL
jgi:hypothetical protein